MTAASYGLTSADIEQFTGITFTDMKIDGRNMTALEWDTFCLAYIDIIAQTVHNYLNVPTFDPAQPEAAIVELHSGKGATDDSVWPVQYTAADGQFYLKELYYSTPAIVIEEDTAGKTAVPAWTARTPRSALAGGDYEVITKGLVTMISFHNNIPAYGTNNLRFTYTTGYPATSKPYKDIKFQVLRVFKNLILVKKNIQAVLTITAQGGRDFQGLTNQYNEGQILSHMEESVLKRYRRWMVPGGPFMD
jgi:hypothetical protein